MNYNFTINIRTDDIDHISDNLDIVIDYIKKMKNEEQENFEILLYSSVPNEENATWNPGRIVGKAKLEKKPQSDTKHISRVVSP